MREIKFRAWNKDNKEMMDSISLISIMEINFKDYELYNYEFMQYTGLKDKNGEDIYEGDIVTQYETPKNAYDIKQQIFFADGMFCVGKIGETETPLYLETNTHHRKKEVNLIEIIGNIYKNKELLNEKN